MSNEEKAIQDCDCTGCEWHGACEYSHLETEEETQDRNLAKVARLLGRPVTPKQVVPKGGGRG